MSTDDIIATINNAKPDILLVALGAVKGVAWIEKNRHRLNVGVISHLGATVNFLAGTIERAPRIFQECGLEWVWRIFQEPKLFSRYASDGQTLANLLINRLPLWLRYRLWARKFNVASDEALIDIRQENDETTVTITLGRYPKAEKDSLRWLMVEAVRSGKDVALDFQAAEYVTGDFLGLLLLLQKHQCREGRRLMVRNPKARVASSFHLCGFNPLQCN